jgi:cathepsin F
MRVIALVFVCLAALSVTLASASSSVSRQGSMFDSWVVRFQKEYKTGQEYKERFAVFQKNLELVEEENSLSLGYTLSATDSPFGDLTPEEFQRDVLMQTNKGMPDASVLQAHRRESSSVASPPDTFDWVAKGVVTEVKTQVGGTCWAFSTTGNIEGQYSLYTNNEAIDFAVEQLIECDASFNKTSGEGDCGMFGGWPHVAMDYLKDSGV